MALADVGVNVWPTQLLNGGASDLFGIGSATFDSVTDRLAYVGMARHTDSIAKIHFTLGGTTLGSTLEVRIESVTNGRPSGTLLAANTNVTIAIADTDDFKWKTAVLTAAASVTPGTLFAVVFVYSSGATPNMQFLVGPAFGTVTSGTFALRLQDTGAGTWVGVANLFCWIVEMTTAGPVFYAGLLPLGAQGSVAYNSGSSPNEKALKFQTKVPRRVIGAKVFTLNTVAGADFAISLWPASSSVDGDALGQAVIDGDMTYSATADGYYEVYFGAPVTLAKDTTYYLGLRADTVNNITLAEWDVDLNGSVANAMNAFPIPADGLIHKASRAWAAGTAGAWTDDASMLPHILLIYDQLDDGAGTGGGGGMRLAGRGGLAA